jgi:hypothetical protein
VDAFSETPTVEIMKPGSVMTTRLREVCRQCNGGWMSALEQGVRTPFERMWQPNYLLGFTALSREEVKSVAAWAVKTAWVRERVGSQKTTTTPEMRHEFASSRTPPPFTSVWAAWHRGRSNFGVYVLQVEARHQDYPLDAHQSRHVLVCSLTFRGLSLLVRTDNGWGAPPMTLHADRWAPVWPCQDTLIWPPPVAASDDDVLDVVAGFSAWMPLPKIAQFHRHPDGVKRVRRN